MNALTMLASTAKAITFEQLALFAAGIFILAWFAAHLARPLTAEQKQARAKAAADGEA